MPGLRGTLYWNVRITEHLGWDREIHLKKMKCRCRVQELYWKRHKGTCNLRSAFTRFILLKSWDKCEFSIMHSWKRCLRCQQNKSLNVFLPISDFHTILRATQRKTRTLRQKQCEIVVCSLASQRGGKKNTSIIPLRGSCGFQVGGREISVHTTDRQLLLIILFQNVFTRLFWGDGFY